MKKQLIAASLTLGAMTHALKADTLATAITDMAASVSCNAFIETTKDNSTVDIKIKALVWGMLAGKAAEMTNETVTLQAATLITRGIANVGCITNPNAKLYEILRDH